MKTRIEWRHGARVLKLDDTDYEVFPEAGDIVELEEDGETHRFTVKSIDSAVVELEVAPDDAEVTHPDGEPNVAAVESPTTARPLTADQQQARVRKAERLAAEKSAEKQKARKFKVTPSKKKK